MGDLSSLEAQDARWDPHPGQKVPYHRASNHMQPHSTTCNHTHSDWNNLDMPVHLRRTSWDMGGHQSPWRKPTRPGKNLHPPRRQWPRLGIDFFHSWMLYRNIGQNDVIWGPAYVAKIPTVRGKNTHRVCVVSRRFFQSDQNMYQISPIQILHFPQSLGSVEARASVWQIHPGR